LMNGGAANFLHEALSMHYRSGGRKCWRGSDDPNGLKTSDRSCPRSNERANWWADRTRIILFRSLIDVIPGRKGISLSDWNSNREASFLHFASIDCHCSMAFQKESISSII
jgi:hypothetical protein